MRNPTYEQALEKQGVGFTYHEEILLEETDTKSGIQNQARLVEPLDEDLVERYRAAYKEKVKFPPLVLWRPSPRRRYIPIDGNQRLEAGKRAGVKAFDAYVVDTVDPVVVDRLTWTFNNSVNGKRLSHAECLQHALTFVRKYEMTIRDAAREWGVNEKTLQGNLRAAEMRDLLAKNNVKETKALSDITLKNMSSLTAMGEDVFVAAAKVVAGNGLSGEETSDLLKHIRKAPTHAARMAAIGEYESSDAAAQRRAQTRNGQIVAKPRLHLRLLGLLRQLDTMLDGDRKLLLDPVQGNRKTTSAVAASVVDKLTSLYGLGTVPSRKGAVG